MGRMLKRTPLLLLVTTIVTIVVGVLSVGVAMPNPDTLTKAENLRLGLYLIISVVLGVVALALMPLALRDNHVGHGTRWWSVVAAMVVIFIGPTEFAIVSAVIVMVSLASRRTWWLTLLTLAMGAVSLTFELTVRTRFFPLEGDSLMASDVRDIAVVYLLFAVIVLLIGQYRGERRRRQELLRQRLRRAERSAAVAAAEERTRIARDMHDSLSHRLSLIGVHAAVLANRTDLKAEKIREEAELIRVQSAEAVEDLRQTLRALRMDDRVDPRSSIPDIVAGARRAGMDVEVVDDTFAGISTVVSELPTVVAHCVFRVVQEGLTNARKHAPGQPVRLLVADSEVGPFRLSMSNPLADAPDAGPGGGFGLAGLKERAQLVGAVFHSRKLSDSFEVELVFPAPSL